MGQAIGVAGRLPHRDRLVVLLLCGFIACGLTVELDDAIGAITRRFRQGP